MHKPCEVNAPAMLICVGSGFSDFSLNFVVLSTIVHPFVFFSLFFLWNPDKLISFGIYVCSVECQIA